MVFIKRKKEHPQVTNSALNGVRTAHCCTSFGNPWRFCSLAAVLYSLSNAHQPVTRPTDSISEVFWPFVKTFENGAFSLPHLSRKAQWISAHSPCKLFQCRGLTFSVLSLGRNTRSYLGHTHRASFSALQILDRASQAGNWYEKAFPTYCGFLAYLTSTFLPSRGLYSYS